MNGFRYRLGSIAAVITGFNAVDIVISCLTDGEIIKDVIQRTVCFLLSHQTIGGIRSGSSLPVNPVAGKITFLTTLPAQRHFFFVVGTLETDDHRS